MNPARTLLTTRDAAIYCGYKNPSGIRKAVHEGRLWPAGRRGGHGPHTFRVEDLDRFMRGERPRGIEERERAGAPPAGGDHED